MITGILLFLMVTAALKSSLAAGLGDLVTVYDENA
jgi:hypothetical protein